MQLGQADTGTGGVLGMGVDAGPDRRPAERHGQQLVARDLGATDGFLDLAGVATELLTEADRRRVLEVGPARLDHRPELVGLGRQRRLQLDEGRDERLLDGHRGGQLERRRDGVVGALAAIDVVVRVDTRRAAKPAGGEVGHDLVHVRVGRGARTGLVDVDRELVVVIAVGDRGGGRRDGMRHIRVEQAEARVGLRRRQLDEGEGAQEPSREALAGDGEVEDGALGGGAVAGIGGNGQLAHRVALHAGRRWLVGHGVHPRTTARPMTARPTVRGAHSDGAARSPEAGAGVQGLGAGIIGVGVDLDHDRTEGREPGQPVDQQRPGEPAPPVIRVGADRLELADAGDRIPPGDRERGERPVRRLDDEVVLEPVVGERDQSLVLLGRQAGRGERRAMDLDPGADLLRPAQAAGDVAVRERDGRDRAVLGATLPLRQAPAVRHEAMACQQLDGVRVGLVGPGTEGGVRGR